MPFTFSHPAIVLPFLKVKPKWFSTTGLFIGAMAPDLEYFTTMKVGARLSHNPEWIPFFELPLALCYCFVFHFWIRNILIEHLPNFFRERFIVFKRFDWKSYFKSNYWIVITSILLGAYSHIFWDAFTHESGYFVKKIPSLQEVWFSKPIEVNGYKFLQHFSTLVGGIAILYVVKNLPRETISKKPFPFIFWIKVLIMALFIMCIRFIIKNDDIAIGNIIVSVIMGGFIALLILSFTRKSIDECEKF